MILNWLGSAFEPAREPTYKFAFQQSYTFPEKQQTYRLNHMYYVSPYTVRDFNHD